MIEVALRDGTIAYEFEDIAFVNTDLFTQTARDFERNKKVYCKAHEKSAEYREFWDLEERRLKHGMTAPGKLYTDEFGIQKIQEVRITGEHYGYLNYGRIKLTQDKEDALLGKGDENILKNRSAEKTESFPAFWDGDYHYFHARELGRKLGYNLIVAKARRKGYSFKNAYICAHTAIFKPKSTTIIGAFEKKYLTTGDGTTMMTKTVLDWFEEYTDFNRGFLSDDIENLELGYMPEGTRLRKGYRSKIISLSFKDNPDAAIGKDGTLIIIDEAGRFPGITDMLDVTLPTLEDGELITGQIIVFGTGGTKEANWKEFEKLFYELEKYRFMPFHNIWDDGKIGTNCGFFHSHILNLKPHIDKEGNSIKDKALISTNKLRDYQKQHAKTTQDYVTYLGQRCIKPSEAFSSGSVSLFDSADLRNHSDIVEHDPRIRDLHREGIVKHVGGEYKLIPNRALIDSERHPPLFSYKTNLDKDFTGCFVEWHPPFKVNGKVPDNLYRIWVDPYAYKKYEGDIKISDSLGTAYVYERINNITYTKGDIIVGCRVGRPGDPDDFNADLLAIAQYYNATVQFERDRGNIEDYFKRAGFYHLLADEPDFHWRRELAGKKTLPQKGILMSEGSKRKETAALLLRQWLYQNRGKTHEDKNIFNFTYLYDLGLLDELKYWNLKGNFDRVSALLVGMLDMNEIIEKEIEVATNEATASVGFFNREFF